MSDDVDAVWRVVDRWRRECDRAETHWARLEIWWKTLREESAELGEPYTSWVRDKMDEIEGKCR